LPTAAGEELLGHARRVDAAAVAALEAMSHHTKGIIGRVRIGTGATACIYFLPPILRRLRAKFPALDIVVRTGNTPDILKSIEDNTIDVGLVTLPAAGRMFDVKPVMEDEFLAITAGNAPLPAGRVAPSDLAALPIVLYESGAHTRLLIDRWATRAGHTLKPMMELGSIEAIKELVGAGLGCSIVPCMALRGAGTRQRIATRPLHPRLCRQLAIVLRRDKPLQRGLQEVVAAVKAAARDFGVRAPRHAGLHRIEG
jgi:DNA-binding transcriptional LysR family regulator